MTLQDNVKKVGLKRLILPQIYGIKTNMIGQDWYLASNLVHFYLELGRTNYMFLELKKPWIFHSLHKQQHSVFPRIGPDDLPRALDNLFLSRRDPGVRVRYVISGRGPQPFHPAENETHRGSGTETCDPKSEARLSDRDGVRKTVALENRFLNRCLGRTG